MAGIIKKASLAFLIILIAGCILFIYLYTSLKEFGQSRYILDDPLLFRVEKGDSASRVITNLYEAGISQSRGKAMLYFRVFFKDRTLKAGLYSIPRASSLYSVLDMIARGDIATEKLTVIEGFTIWDINEIIMRSSITGKEDFLMLCYSKEFLIELNVPYNVLEGYIYPDTYIFPLGIELKDALRIMVRRTFDVYENIMHTAVNPMEIGPALILASLIEKESPQKDEGPLVASVYLNRLKKDMLLQCDPTVIYGLKRHGLYRGVLLKKDLQFDDTYNTYLYKGLPPSPIASPGYYSIFSAMNPADTDYFYFVAKDDSSHAFSRTYREHLQNIKRIRGK